MTQNMLKPELLEGKELPRDEVLNILVPFVKSLPHSFVIALNSPWGTGKTTFVHQFIDKLGEGYPAIYYNAWKADYSNDPFVDFCAEILALEDNEHAEPSSEKKDFLQSAKTVGSNFWKNKGKITTSVIAKIATKEVADALGGDDYSEEISNAVSNMVSQQFDEYSARKSCAEDFTGKLEKFVAKVTEDKGPLIIFVDELDRCRPTYAIELLERIKHLFDVDNIIFVLSVDLQQLKYAAESIYGSGMQSDEYLRRFFNVTLNLPPLPMGIYCNTLSELYGLTQYNIRYNLLSFAKKYDMSLRQMDRIFTIIKIKLSGREWNLDYAANIVFLAALKVLDNEKYIEFKKLNPVSSAFELFIKEVYEGEPYCAASVMNYLLFTMSRVYNINTNEKIEQLINDPFWKEAFESQRSARGGDLRTLFNRLDFTADHAGQNEYY